MEDRRHGPGRRSHGGSEAGLGKEQADANGPTARSRAESDSSPVSQLRRATERPMWDVTSAATCWCYYQGSVQNLLHLAALNRSQVIKDWYPHRVVKPVS